MILVTGATGFIGRALLRQLAAEGREVRCLLRPARRTPNLPKGVSVQVALAALNDERGLRTALAGVDTLIHLAGAQWQGDPFKVDVNGTRILMEAARAAEVGQIVYLSHLGADRASGYPALKAKGIAEEFVRQSGRPFTIIRSALVYGEEDIFVNALAALLKLSPGFFFMPGDGLVSLQPLWVNDLAQCLTNSVGAVGTLNQTLAVGGPEFLTLRQMLETLMEVIRTPRWLVAARQPLLRVAGPALELLFPRWPLTTRWLDYLAVNRTCEIISVTRFFGVRPARFVPATLAYLRRKNLLLEMARLTVG